MYMAQSPLMNLGSAAPARPPYEYTLSFRQAARWPMCFWPNSLLMRSSTPSTPPNPFCFVAKGWSWVACMFSTIVQDGHAVEKPHLAAPEPMSFLAADSTSGHVFGGFSGSRPAFL